MRWIGSAHTVNIRTRGRRWELIELRLADVRERWTICLIKSDSSSSAYDCVLDLIPSSRFHKLSLATTVAPIGAVSAFDSTKRSVVKFRCPPPPTLTLSSSVSPQADTEEWAGRMPVPTRCRWSSTGNRLVSLQSSRRQHTALIMCWFWCEMSRVHKWCH